MKYAIIENNTVINTIECTADFAANFDLAVQSDVAKMGDSYDGSNFIPPTPTITLDEAKQQKEAEIHNAYRAEDSTATVEFNGNTFHGGIESARKADDKAKMIIRVGLKQGGTEPFSTTFNDINRNPIDLNTEQLQDLAVVIGIDFETRYQKKTQLLREITQAISIETVDNISW